MEDIKIAIKTMQNSNKFNGCYLWGQTSTGKTYTIEKVLGKDAVFVSTHITPLALYVLLYQNNGKIVVIDDIDKIDDSIIAILKAALWEVNGKRTLNWISTSKVLFEVGIPSEFEYTGKIIITCNDQNTHKKFEPLLARLLVVNQILTKEQFKTICKNIFESYNLDSFDSFEKGYLNIYTEGLHLRNVLKHCEYLKNGFDTQAHKVFSVNEHFKFFEVSQVSSVSLLQKAFEEKFGYGRATFFRYWKKYKELKDNGW